MKTITDHLGQILLAVAAVALIVGVVLSFATPIGNMFNSVIGKTQEQAQGDIWNMGSYDVGSGNSGGGETETTLAPGLYETGTTTLLKSWDELVNEGILTVSDGAVMAVVGQQENITGDLVISTGVTTIPVEAFSYCTNLTSVTIPDGATIIDAAAFEQCEALTSVSIPGSVTTIEYDAFRYCESLSSVVFGVNSQLTSIGSSAFLWTGLTSIELPANVNSIGDYAFEECTSLTKVIVKPTTPPSVQTNAFSNCPLAQVIVPADTADTYKSASGWNTFANIIVEQ